MNKENRFILVETFKDDSIKTIIGSFNEICNEIEYQNKKADSDDFKTKKIVVYDRKYSDSGLELNCWQEVGDDILYSQFIDSYFGDDEL